MPFSDHNPRLKFLKDSASTLNAGSPSTAAYLMTVHNHIFLDECKPLNPRQQETSCGACGSTRNFGTTKTIHVTKEKSLQRASAAKGIAAHGATVYKCLRCRRRTVKPSRMGAARPKVTTKPKLETPQSKPLGDSSAEQAPDAAEVNQPGKAADNASSKKRAKARKQGGLQALLASKQKAQSNSSSLDLFDFLQQ
ncbi:ribonuclease P Rpr2/Rpp21/SNM1 subunit [Aspergillus affinis]|uniref:ribonuclease P Rpr2/Rpp21/SNM1 subunit n=1 Tax=Aspergillus affinis TaxID=1070780 RepID=UPI0022FEC325|nr:uncharacterized protein KD926_009313 [Aspergillus affinis]KAI9039588.1 hypothetical protein KD926_009313 [Aspergillus affinis]